MKRITLLLMVLLICSSSFWGCDLLNVDDDYEETEKEQPKEDKQENKDPDDDEGPEISNETKLKEFTDLLISSEYVKAIEYYNENIVGNYDLEYNANESILNICKDIDSKVLSGEYDQKQVDTKLGVIDKVIEGIEVVPNGYEDLVDKIEVSLASKSAFLAAKDFEQMKMYLEAAEEYEKVIDSDSNYTLAQESAANCVNKFKTDIIETAQKYADDNDYMSAIKAVKDAAEKLSDDSELLAKITVYEKAYINYVIMEAEKAFVTPADDYTKSLAIINAALQNYPQNEEIKAKKEYYASFAPVSLSTLKVYQKDCSISETYEDLYGQTHKNVIKNLYYDDYGCIIYVLGGKYNKLTITVFGNGNTYYSENQDVSVRDFSLGNYEQSTCLYSSEKILPSSKPFQVEINVTGVELVRIWVGDTAYIGDCVVQKTVK